ncbi:MULTISPECIES: hypothetical protein [Haloferax]|uniref:hypothetical protein n=1 Tax=Haloferax TaxID=2251 RepID=UPI0015F2BD04|nr:MULTISPECIES: hypothetical protein [Haloferax]MDS0242721.1 hypothetical protein [Haloferax sp. S2CR25]MDS0445842.1 hypothetical protein [Haloferax sp. S2CR25-2]
MTYYPTCAVCRMEVDPSEDYVSVEAEYRFTADRNDVDDYYLHQRCAMSIFDGWGEP